MEDKQFENVKNQIGFCGIWCGSCGGGNGVVQELARRFAQTAKEFQLEKWAPKEMNFKEFMNGLECIQETSSCPGCQKGGGPSDCKIRLCAQNKGVTSCSQCVQLAECKNFEHLEEYNPKIKEGLLEIKKNGQAKLEKKWMRELQKKWPHCILLCESAREITTSGQ